MSVVVAVAAAVVVLIIPPSSSQVLLVWLFLGLEQYSPAPDPDVYDDDVDRADAEDALVFTRSGEPYFYFYTA